MGLRWPHTGTLGTVPSDPYDRAPWRPGAPLAWAWLGTATPGRGAWLRRPGSCVPRIILPGATAARWGRCQGLLGTRVPWQIASR